MPTFSDIQLMAYADGELPAAEAAAITEALDSDPTLAARIEHFAASRRALKRAFALPAAAPLSPALQKLLAPAAAAPLPRRPRARWPLALAASLVLGLGAVIGHQLTRPAPDALSAALETLPSGEISRSAGGEIVALSTLAAADGSLCREYERGSQRGLACREPEGRWRERLLPAAPVTTEPGSYQLASGEPVDAAIALKARRLNPEEERQLLRQGWRD